MPLNRRQCVAALTIPFLAGSALAETFPSRPIRLIVPYAPGGSTDLIGRMVAEPLGRALGQAVVVDNRGGAGGMLGTGEGARAKPDGYTLVVGTVSTMVIFPAVHPKPGYALKDFVPVTNIAEMPNIIAVNPNFPAKNLHEFIAALKASPDKYSFATSGTGSINHMLGESFQAAAGVKLMHVPYKGAGPAMQDVMAGQVDILVDQLPSSKGFIDSGKLKLIGVISPKRVPEYPDVMTMEEAGLAGFTDRAWYGIVAPAGLPAEVMARLSAAMKDVLAQPDVRARLQKVGAAPVGNSAAEFQAQIQSEIGRMKKLVQTRNISLDNQ